MTGRLIGLKKGSQILHAALASQSITRVDTLSRRTPDASATPHTKLTTFVSPDTSQWANQISSLSPPPTIFFSSFGTTRGAAGGFENQYKLDHDLNLELAKAARDAGTKVYVLISASGANPTSSIPYSRMKGELEKNVEELGFERTVILRPGLIAGQRAESRPLEAGARYVAGFLGRLHPLLKNPWAQDADIIGKAAVNAGVRALDGDELLDGDQRVFILHGKEILDLGKGVPPFKSWN